MKSHAYLILSMKLKDQATDSYIGLKLRDEFLAGDDNAYSSIYKLYAKDLYSFGLSIHPNPGMIEDAIHDIFVEIYSNKQNLAKVENLKFYFMAAFRNRLFSLLKKQSFLVPIIDKETYELTERDCQEMWIEKESISEKELLVKNLLSELNQNQREAIYHRFVEGHSLEEIALLMNINYQSAKNLIHRSIKKLKSVATFASLLYLLFCLK